MVLYYIVIGDTSSQLWAQFFIKGAIGRKYEDFKLDLVQEAWWVQVITHRTSTIILVGCISLIFIFKQQLEELKSISYVFLTVVFLFIALLFVELVRDKDLQMESFDEMAAVKVDYHLLTAFSIFLFAYAFQFMVFPAYNELENKRGANRFAWSSAISIIIYTTALVSTGIICVLHYGSNLKPDLLINVATKANGVSVFLRTVYCFILLFHLPYIFFAIKEYTLVMYDELVSRSLSEHLEKKQ